MKRLRILAMLVFFTGSPSVKAEEKIVVGGSGGLFDEVKEIANIYQAKNPSHRIEVMKESMATGGSIEATKVGRLTIGLVGRQLTDEERGKLVYRGVSRVPIGIGVHKSLPVGNLSESQICDIFSGRIKSWKEVAGGDGNIMVLTVVKRNDVFGGSVRKHMSCFKDLNISSEAVVLNRIQELQDAINQRPGTVGIISVTPEMNNTRLNIKAVAVGGVTPSTEALRSGKYKLFHEYGAVTLGEPQGTARRFLDFVAGPEGEKVMARGGMIAVRQP